MLANTIVLGGCVHYPQEQQAMEAIVPGALIEFETTAGPNQGKVKNHATAAANAPKAFATETLLFDRSVPGQKQVDTPYQVNESVRWVMAGGGALVNARVNIAAAAIAKGQPVESAGGGFVRLHTPAANNFQESIIGYAAESVDNSGGATPARLAIWVA